MYIVISQELDPHATYLINSVPLHEWVFLPNGFRFVMIYGRRGTFCNINNPDLRAYNIDDIDISYLQQMESAKYICDIIEVYKKHSSFISLDNIQMIASL